MFVTESVVDELQLLLVASESPAARLAAWPCTCSFVRYLFAASVGVAAGKTSALSSRFKRQLQLASFICDIVQNAC